MISKSIFKRGADFRLPFDGRAALLAFLLAVAGAVAGAQGQHAHHAPSPTKERPQLGSGVAFAADGSLWLVGLNADRQLFVQTAPASDLKRWGAPRLLGTAGEAISADGENRPKIAFGPRGEAVISYTHPLKRPFSGWIRMLRSVDDGKTFGTPFTVHADRQEITHRFESIAFDPQGVLHTVWIDKRDLEAASKVDGKPVYRGAAIYRNESPDGGATFGPDIKVADHSCECCRLALASRRDGALAVMWRHVFEPNVRDHGVVVLAGGTPAKVVRASYDEWKVDACPHHGPGLAPATDGGFHAVWFGIRSEAGAETPAVRYARLNADGSPRIDTVRALPDEGAEHADVAVAGERVAVVWRSFDGSATVLRAWLSVDGGQNFRLVDLGRTQEDNDHPRLAVQGGRIAVVWRNAREVQVHEPVF